MYKHVCEALAQCRMHRGIFESVHVGSEGKRLGKTFDHFHADLAPKVVDVAAPSAVHARNAVIPPPVSQACSVVEQVARVFARNLVLISEHEEPGSCWMEPMRAHAASNCPYAHEKIGVGQAVPWMILPQCLKRTAIRGDGFLAQRVKLELFENKSIDFFASVAHKCLELLRCAVVVALAVATERA